MGAVWMRVRSELRGRARATVALALLIALGGGAVLTAAAAARRTDSAYPRFLRAHGAADILASDRVGGQSFDDGTPLSVHAFAEMDAVVSAQKLRFYLLANTTESPECLRDPACAEERGFFTAEARSLDRAGPPIDTYKILQGRAPDPARADEAVLTLPSQSTRWPSLRVGASMELRGAEFIFPEFARAAETKPLMLKIVGLAAVPGDFPPQSGDETVVMRLTPAFYERYPERAFGFPGGVALRLDETPHAIDRFRASYAKAGGNPAFTIERHLQDANVQRSIHLQALALWVLAAAAAVAFVLLFGQTLARQIFIESDDRTALNALGMTRGDLVFAALCRAAIAATAGAALAVIGAVIASPFSLSGLARIAEPEPGIDADLVALGIGAVTIIACVVMLAVVPALRAYGARRVHAEDPRPSAIVAATARIGRLPSTVAGARFALQRGRGRTAMPIRSTIASLTLGLLTLAAATTFAASLDHFLDSPRLYGVTWDGRISVEPSESFTDTGRQAGEPFDLPRIARELVARDPSVRGVSVGLTGLNLAVGGHVVEALAMEPVAGDAPLPPLIAGRHPRTQPRDAEQEIVLGPRLFDRVGVRIGETVDAMFLDGSEQPIALRVVGKAVVPFYVDTSRIGEAALVTPSGVARAIGPLSGIERDLDTLFVAGDVHRRGGAGHPAVVEEIAAIAGQGARPDEHVHLWADRAPADVVNFGRVQRMPLFLGGLLALFAAATLVHTLVTAISRRRRDLAILKTIGFVSRQVRRAVRVQALILSSIALLVGLPSGIALGRWLWTFFATEQGIVAEPVISGATILAGIAGTLLVAMLISIAPARTAARTQPAVVLRTE